MSRQTHKTRPDAQNDLPAGFAARRAALSLLDSVVRRGQPLEQALGVAARNITFPADRALAHGIAAQVLRHLPDLDDLIDSATPRPLPEDAKARMVLRLALAQALLLETPHHAVIATCLPLVDGGPRKLVHGVLGALFRRGVTLPESARLPAEVEHRWEASWGEEVVASARSAIAHRPPLDLSLRNTAETDEWAGRLGGVSLAPGHVRLPPETEVTGLEGFAEGQWWVQDLAASLPARLLGEGEGRAVLDLCAAPGGKTMQLASAGWKVTAVDQSQRRMERLRSNLDRTGLEAEVIQADLRKWAPDGPLDAILLDAPCSATGIFRRHPDVIHRVGDRQIAEMAELQAELLERVIGWLKPGGVLIYATCSLEPSEGEAQIASLLERHADVVPAPINVSLLPSGIVPATPYSLRTVPGVLAEQGGLDGFFIATVTRAG